MVSAVQRASRPPSTSLLSPSRMGDVNRSRVVAALCDHGPLSRADLAKIAGVTRMTISNIVNGLLADGLLEERDAAPARGAGKPPRPVWFAPGAGLSCAVVLRASGVEVAMVDARGEILDATSGAFDAGASTEAEVISRVGRSMNKVLPRTTETLLGVGVAVPGVCDTASSEVLGSGQIPALRGSGLAQALAGRFGVRVLLDNDARVQALGEKWFGAGRGVGTFASVQTGPGLGVGVVVGGVVFRGAHAEAGELGHTCVVAHGGANCRCGLSGCWETIATLGWLRTEAGRARLPDALDMDSARLSDLVVAGSRKAAMLQDRYADNLALGLANLIHLIDPELIVLQGDVVGGGMDFLDLMRARLRARTLGEVEDSVLGFSSLDGHAGLLGAAALVLSETFRPVS